MKAILQDAYGAAATLQRGDLPVPEISDDQLLVRVASAGVDRGAYHLMRGLPYIVRIMGYGLRAPKTPVPGTSIAGRVEATGRAVTQFEVGDKVDGTCKGAFAEYAAADEGRMAPKPAALTFEEASELPYPGSVSLQAVRDQARVQPGERVLIVGASGAVGTIAVQIAKAFGAEVTGVCGGGASTSSAASVPTTSSTTRKPTSPGRPTAMTPSSTSAATRRFHDSEGPSSPEARSSSWAAKVEED